MQIGLDNALVNGEHSLKHSTNMGLKNDLDSTLSVGGKSGSLNSFQAYFFTVNTVMGTGFLCIPWVFQNSGWLIGIFVLALFAAQSAWLAFMLLESMSRTQALAVLEDHEEHVPKTTICEAANMFRRDSVIQLTVYSRIEDNAQLDISDRRMDLTSMVRLLFGDTTSRVYIGGFCLVFSGVLISYCSVFASSFASTISIAGYETCSVYTSFEWECRWKYSVYLAVFVGLELILTLTSFEEQRWLQSAMACLRYISILIIIVTCFNAVYTDLSISGKTLKDEYPNAITLNYIVPAILISQFSFIYHPQLPCIAQSMQDRKGVINKIIWLCSATCFLVYCSIGLLLPAAVNEVPSLCTIAYHEYSGGYPFDERPWWAAFISYIIVLFPAIDVVTTFPILAISLSHNIYTIKYGSSQQIPKNFDRCVRVSVAVLPGTVAFFFYDLSHILSFTSYIALALIPMMIPLIFNASRSLVGASSHFQAKRTSYTSSSALAGIQLSLIVVLFGISLSN